MWVTYQEEEVRSWKVGQAVLLFTEQTIQDLHKEKHNRGDDFGRLIWYNSQELLQGGGTEDHNSCHSHEGKCQSTDWAFSSPVNKGIMMESFIQFVKLDSLFSLVERDNKGPRRVNPHTKSSKRITWDARNRVRKMGRCVTPQFTSPLCSRLTGSIACLSLGTYPSQR